MDELEFLDSVPGINIYYELDVKALFDNYLDERYGAFNVCGKPYFAAEILKSLDSHTYDHEFDMWLRGSGLRTLYSRDNRLAFAFQSDIERASGMKLSPNTVGNLVDN